MGNDDIELTGSRSSTNNGGNGGLAVQHEGCRMKAAEQSRSKQKQSSAREQRAGGYIPSPKEPLRCVALREAVQCDAMRCCVAKTETTTSQFYGPAGETRQH